MNKQKIAFLGLRFSLSLIFLWAFFDKLLGLGFATSPEKAWIQGGSPTYGFLTSSARGPFVEFFNSLAGMPIIDWMFMLGLLFVGITLLVNRYVLWGAIAGALMMFLMWIAAFPPTSNPLIDSHIVYIFALLFIGFNGGRRDFKKI